ncbi:mycofactocin-coupled SDR family oxidoreductase [Amycolatopsis acidicola]|uniref:Mycofactocin-coupled SDR family oxidoreductase n=1 Tax=Amycolatopsis acidicola TaxID=2596893 RepID=A0A5N0UIN0_9PSEU|nr:mycofactocin-coupled SDR family oxidoreductase [Amycolatopsis acidicola]KAA9148633.1 mycofactocin-coupled SDR family oxidoreductase [Amycolatopsis acidicola]
MGRVEGKVAFITGAARGQGRSHALRLAEEGADIVAVDACEDIATLEYPMATEADLRETEKLVRERGRRVLARKVDVRDQAGLNQVAADAVEQLGGMDIVSANAGICGCRPTFDLSDDEWQDMVDVNMTGVWRTVKATVPHLIEAGRGGSVVLTSSIVTFVGAANVAHYNASKSGVVGLMKTLSAELGKHRIRVNAVHPGNVATDMLFSESTLRVFCPDLENPTVEDLRERARGGDVLGQGWVEAEDISNAVLYLASDEARFVTGISLPVDCGRRIG